MKYDFNRFCFIEQELRPEKIAIRTILDEMSWEQLNSAVDAFAIKLKSYNLPSDSPILILGNKEIDFIVSMLACLEINHPYLPVDSSLPQLRVEKYRHELDIQLVVDLVNDKIIKYESKQKLTYQGNLAYILFTSGSSGEPKPVQITRDNLSSFGLWLSAEFEFFDKDEFLNQASFGFDLSLIENIGFLICGGTINLTDKQVQNDEVAIFDFLNSTGVTKWVSTPSYIEKFLRSDRFCAINFPCLNEFIFCGEELTPKLVRRIFNFFPEAKINNSYGPTETTVAVSNYLVTKCNEDMWKERVPIGITNKNITLSDESEILIHGKQVSSGYFNDKKLNSERFFKDLTGRGFKTGDYGNILNNHFYFSGRQENFVKLHGNRVSLSEISYNINKIQPLTNFCYYSSTLP